MLDHLLTLARYHRWATQRLFEHVDRVDDARYRRDVGLFFKSIHGTLNHLLVGEQHLWWARFARGESPRIALDAELEPDRTRLRERLLEGCDRWLAWLPTVEPARIDGTLSYVTMRGTPATLPYAPTLAHVFNHGTHHRGQITAALTALGEPAPELDLVSMLQQEQGAR